jgi:spore germination protein
VVEPGDTLTEIATTFNVPVDVLIETNRIPNPENLVVGQTIVIPIWGSYYFVEAGDTLFTIARDFFVPVSQLIQLNQIAEPDTLQVGTRLYIPQRPRIVKDVATYVDPQITGDRTYREIDQVGDQLTYINIFSYEVNPDGSLTPVADEEALRAAVDNDIFPIMVITNIVEGQFDQDLITLILADEAIQERMLDEIVAIMEAKGYRGIDFDFEYLGAENREPYNDFLRKAVDRFRPLGYTVSTALAPKYYEEQEGILYEGHDYQAQGEIVDYIFFMTYEWGWSGGPPRPVAPIDEVRKVMEYAVSEVPREKVMMGIPLYGYDWELPYEPGGKWARAISSQRAIELASQYNVEIEYDEEAEAPFFNYVDEDGVAHIVWFEDARSMQAKFDLVRELGIKGLYYWVLGRDFPQNWLLIEDNFIVRKRI